MSDVLPLSHAVPDVVEFVMAVRRELTWNGKAVYQTAGLAPWQKQVLEAMAAYDNGSKYFLRRYKTGRFRNRPAWILSIRP